MQMWWLDVWLYQQITDQKKLKTDSRGHEPGVLRDGWKKPTEWSMRRFRDETQKAPVQVQRWSPNSESHPVSSSLSQSGQQVDFTQRLVSDLHIIISTSFYIRICIKVDLHLGTCFQFYCMCFKAFSVSSLINVSVMNLHSTVWRSSCIVGNVGARFGHGRRKCGRKARSGSVSLILIQFLFVWQRRGPLTPELKWTPVNFKSSTLTLVNLNLLLWPITSCPDSADLWLDEEPEEAIIAY